MSLICLPPAVMLKVCVQWLQIMLKTRIEIGLKFLKKKKKEENKQRGLDNYKDHNEEF